MAAAASTSRSKDLSGQDIKGLFQSIDIDGNGEVSLEEFKLLLARMNVAMTSSDAESLFNEADADSSGALDIEEVAAFLQSKPVESSTSTSARALRAGLLAEYYASVAAKAIADSASSSDSSGMSHSLDLEYNFNDGCPSDADAKTTLRISAGGDVLKLLPSSLASASSGIVVEVRLAAGTDADELAALLNAEIFDDAPVAAEGFADDQGSPCLRVAGEGVLDSVTRKLPLDMLAEGTNVTFTLRLRQTVTELLFGLTLAPLADAQAHLVATLSQAAVGMASALGPAPVRALVSCPTRLALSTGTTFRGIAAAMSGEDDVSDEMLQEAAKEISQKTKIAKVVEFVCAGNGMGEDDSFPDEMREMFAKIFMPIVGLKGAFVRAGAIGAVITLESHDFSFVKPTSA